MTWINVSLSILVGISVMLGIYVFPEIGRTYARKGLYTDQLLSLWFAMWAFHHVPLVLASFYGVWPIPIDKTSALVGGAVLSVLGAVILPLGMIEFRTLRRSCGQDISELVTTGVYRWSRNPQFVGWLLVLLGISIAGRSAFAFALTGLFVIVIDLYTVFLAEPYLESLYGDEYRSFKMRAARWIGIPKPPEPLSTLNSA